MSEAVGGSITGYPLDMRDDETEDDYIDRLIELSHAQGIDAGKASDIS